MEDKVKEAVNAYRNLRKKSVVTDFLEPGALSDVLALIQKEPIAHQQARRAYGFREGERGRLVFSPDFREGEDEITLLRITWKSGEILSHRDFLGALLHLGIKREKLGDILVEEGKARIAVDSHLVDYLMLNLEKIGRHPVTITITEDRDPLLPELKEFMVTSNSLRLDAIVSKGYGLSRKESASLIGGGKVKVNFKVVEKTDYLIKEKDLISCLGFGRIKMLDILGKSPKDRYKILLGKFI